MLIKRQNLIEEEVRLYLIFCQNAARHDEQEPLWRSLAHVTFYHIQELRSMKDKTPISN